MKLKTGDKVVVIAGKDKGKEGKILHVDRKNNRVIVEGVNMISKHKTLHAESAGRHREKRRFHPRFQRNVPAQRQSNTPGCNDQDGKKVRVAKKTGEVID